MASLTLKIGYTGETIPVYNIDLKVLKMRELLFIFQNDCNNQDDCDNNYFTALGKNNQPIIECDDIESTLYELGFRDKDTIVLVTLCVTNGLMSCEFSVKYIEDEFIFYKYFYPIITISENDSLQTLIDKLVAQGFLFYEALQSMNKIENITLGKVLNLYDIAKNVFRNKDYVRISIPKYCENETVKKNIHCILSSERILHINDVFTDVLDICNCLVDKFQCKDNFRLASYRRRILSHSEVYNNDVFVVKNSVYQYYSKKYSDKSVDIEVAILDIHETIYNCDLSTISNYTFIKKLKEDGVLPNLSNVEYFILSPIFHRLIKKEFKMSNIGNIGKITIIPKYMID